MPGQRRSRVEALARATVGSPIGPLVLETTATGLVGLSFSRDERVGATGTGGAADEAADEAAAHLAAALAELAEYMAGERRHFDLSLDWARSTGFRRDVLMELARVPYGEVVTYGELASRAGHPNAARAVGTAMATNPLAIVVPCHRVVRAGGEIGSYGGGAGAKRWLLELEGVL